VGCRRAVMAVTCLADAKVDPLESRRRGRMHATGSPGREPCKDRPILDLIGCQTLKRMGDYTKRGR
jgi:hypothetical protein